MTFYIRSALILTLGLIGGSVFAVPAQPTLQFTLPAQPLADSLQAVASQASLNVVFDPPAVADRMAPALQAQLTTSEALTRLLKGTGLQFEFVSDRTVAISIVGSGEDKRADNRMEAIRLAQATANPPPSQRSEVRAAEDSSLISEIIVTAQKRSERLQDVPVPVTAISAEQLADTHQLLLQDYYSLIPGLAMAPVAQSGQALSLRGLSTGTAGNPTVGIVIDDVPYGGSTFNGGGTQVPDFDPSDLVRIEVLRGPQGTLYGASSIGGLMKFVTIDPSTSHMSGRIQAGTNSASNGNRLGFNVRASVNLPVSDSFAVRASGFTRRDPGYIDDIATGQEGVNEADVDGGRVSALWRPRDTFSVKLSALFQQSQGGGGLSDVNPTLGDLKQNYGYLGGSGVYDKKVQAYSAILTGTLGRAELTALSGYSINDIASSFDQTHALSTVSQQQFGVTGSGFFAEMKTEKLTQEVRLAMPLGEKLDWLLGVFYTDEDNSWQQRARSANAAGVVVGELYYNTFPTTYEEYAAFTDLTVAFTERFDVQFGARTSQNKQTYEAFRVGPGVQSLFGAPSPFTIPQKSYDADAFTYLVTPRLKVSPDLMAYARLASGYRAGGPNTSAVLGGAPAQFEPDKTLNYELGVKGSVLNRALSFDASVYYIDWKDIQLGLSNAIATYTDNAGRAKSQGVELSLEARPLTGLTIAGWAAWSDAELTEPFPASSPSFGAPGNRLPFSSRFSANASIHQEWALADRVTGFVGGSASFVGDRLGVFRGRSGINPLPRQDYPGYTKMDLLAGVRYDTWTVNVFINNVADKRGVLAGGLSSFNAATFNYIPPRTAGVSLTKTFQ